LIQKGLKTLYRRRAIDYDPYQAVCRMMLCPKGQPLPQD
jgi:hypothetical protein